MFQANLGQLFFLWFTFLFSRSISHRILLSQHNRSPSPFRIFLHISITGISYIYSTLYLLWFVYSLRPILCSLLCHILSSSALKTIKFIAQHQKHLKQLFICAEIAYMIFHAHFIDTQCPHFFYMYVRNFGN